MAIFYHMVIEPKINLLGDTTERKEYISTRQEAAPTGYRCVAICGFHEKPNKVKYPCRSCVYSKACGDNTRTMPCNGRQTKRQQKGDIYENLHKGNQRKTD